MSLKILLADDSMTAQNMGKKILSDAGYDVVAVSNGAQAVKKIAEHKPDIAILDIYMPGYTGLEVCERVKSTLESSKTPVLLTVGKMEPYRPEDGSRVRADGVIVKPFEATDLLAIVEKLAGRVPTPPPPKPSYEETMVIPPPTAADFEDGSNSKSATDDGESTGPDRFDVPQDMQVAPAMGFEDFGVEPVQAEIASSQETSFAVESAAAHAEVQAGIATLTPSFQPIGFVTDEYSAVDATDEPTFAAGPESLLETPYSGKATTSDEPLVQPFEVEFTSAPSLDNVEVETVAELEPTVSPDQVQVEAVTESALADPTELASEFATGFGTADGEEVTVGIVPELRGHEEILADALAPSEETAAPALDDFEARVAAAMAAYNDSSTIPEAPVSSESQSVETPAWKVEEAPVEAHEASISLEQEMAQLAENQPISAGDLMESAPEIDEIDPSVAEVVAQAEIELPEPVATEAPAEMFATATSAEVTNPIVESFEAPSAPSVQELEFAAAMLEATRDKAPEPVHVEELATAAAASVGTAAFVSAIAQPSAAKLDESRIAHAIQRVLERFKPQLVSEIARELASDEDEFKS